jgi:hypothetical protein
MKNISLRLPEELHARLDRASRDRGEAKSDVVRTALEVYLSGTKSSAGVSCTELAGDLVGSLEGPIDLATNPRHMTGYGQ